MTAAADHFTFDVVWKGVWYRLASGAWHRKKNVGIPGSPEPETFILFDRLSREHKAPKAEVHIRDNAPLP